MFLIAGLGNPGSAYAATRHNIGFMAVDALAALYHFPAFSSRHHSLCSKGRIQGEEVLLLKPQTFMNRSGIALAEVARFYKTPPNRIWVIYDELDLAPTRIRLKRGGSDGGHNGIKSIDQHLGREYGRIRLGIGRPEHKSDVTDYVLSNFTTEEQSNIEKLLHLLASELPTLLEGREDLLMNNVARGMHPTPAPNPTKE